MKINKHPGVSKRHQQKIVAHSSLSHGWICSSRRGYGKLCLGMWMPKAIAACIFLKKSCAVFQFKVFVDISQLSVLFKYCCQNMRKSKELLMAKPHRPYFLCAYIAGHLPDILNYLSGVSIVHNSWQPAC